MRRLGLALLIFAGLQDAAKADDYAHALDALSAHSRGFGFDGTREGRDAQAALWRAAQQWTVRYLDAHPTATPADLAKASEGGGRPQLSAIALDAGTVLVATQQGETGNVFIAARGAGGFAIVWDVARVKPSKRFPSLAAWSLDGADERCPQRHGAAQRDRCGPLYASVLLVPRDASGRARFAIDATYAQEMGSEVAKQLSLWRWNGRAAELLLAGNYPDVLDDDAGVRIENGKLLARQKHDFKIAQVSAPDPGRARDWIIRLGPEGVRDLATVEASPEAAAVDDALWAALRGRRDPRMTMRTQRALKAVLRGATAFDELLGDRVVRDGNGAKVCFNLDDFGPLWFSLIPAGSTYSIVDLTRGNGVDCALPGEK